MQTAVSAPATPATPVVTPADPCIAYADLPKLGTYLATLGGTAAAIMRGLGDAPDYLLIVAQPDSPGHIDSIVFSKARKHVAGADDDTDGHANTLALINSGIAHPAAEFCRAVNIGAHTDWYLPARHELRACYLNTPELFDTGDRYWSSTQYAGTLSYAWVQYFVNGYQDSYHKDYEGRCRAVRRLAIL